MFILRIIHSLLFALWMAFSFIFGTLLTIIISLFLPDKKKAFHFSARIWARLLLFVAGIRVKAKGLENIPQDQSTVFVSNHQGNFDTLTLLAYLPVQFRFIIKKELFRIPFFGWYIKQAGYIYLDRQAIRKAHKTLLKTTQRLEKGESIVVFPEGTRSPDGNLQEFKRGGMLLAFEAKTFVVPLAIAGTYQIQPKGSILIRPAKVNLNIGKPLDFSTISEDDVSKQKEATEKIRKIIAELLLPPA